MDGWSSQSVTVSYARGGRVHGQRAGKSQLALEHSRLPTAKEAGRMKAYWRERVATLKEQLEK